MNTASGGESPDYPGTPQHQALLQTIVAHYRQDPRMRAVVVFGSLGRGDWDALSDIDLDVVIADGITPDVKQELRQLCAAFAPLGEHAAVIVPDGDDAADAVLESLMMLSVRYHPLATTKAAIVDSMQVLAGPLDHATIAAAGLANEAASEPPVEQLLDECVRYAAVASVYVQRGSSWLAIEVLHRMRTLLIEIYTRTHGGGRVLHHFDATAPAVLKEQLIAALPQANPHSMNSALTALLDVVEFDLHRWTNGQLQITEGQQSVIRQVRARLAHLHFVEGIRNMLHQTSGDVQATWNQVLAAYLDGEVTLGRAAELLGITRFDLQERFNRLGLPLRIGPADLAEAQQEVKELRAA